MAHRLVNLSMDGVDDEKYFETPGFVLPIDLKDEMSNIWLADSPSSQSNWRLFIDQQITI